MNDIVYTQEKKPLKNPFSHNKSKNSGSKNRKALATPFGASNNTYDSHNEYNDQVLDQSPNQSPALRNPYGEESTGYGYDDSQLEGNISLEPQSEYNQRAPERSRQAQRNHQNQHDFIAVGPSSDQPFEPDFVKNNSIMNSVMGFAGLLGANTQAKGQAQEYDEENEPPLLEDLGIDLKLIKMRTLSVLKFEKCQEEFVKEADMSGPLFLILVFGMLLLFSGKVHFGYIYGFSMVGTIAVYLMVNFLSQNQRVQLYNTMSILGYCLFPIVLLAAINVFFSLVNFLGFLLCAGAIAWATLAARNFFQVLLSMDQQKWLIAYPIGLFYVVFVLITIF